MSDQRYQPAGWTCRHHGGRCGVLHRTAETARRCRVGSKPGARIYRVLAGGLVIDVRGRLVGQYKPKHRKGRA